MRIRTNTLIVLTSALLLATAGLSLPALASADPQTNEKPIPVTLIMDETGANSVYGLPVQLASKLAIADINSHGGVLGRPLKLIDLNSQSSQSKDVILARQAAASDTAVVMGGILSSTERAMRPTFYRAKKLYFYNNIYEGGICDRYMFNSGIVPTQQMAPSLKYEVKHGLKKWYVMAANYNYGHGMVHWIEHFAHEYGAEIVGGGAHYYPLTDSDFSSVLPQIQSSGANLIVAALVGASQSNFYSQWAAAGLNKTTTVLSPNFGGAGEEVTLGAAAKGIEAPYMYMPTAHLKSEDNFAAAWKASNTKLTITPNAAIMWTGWHIWAEAANKAHSIDADKVIAELETGNISYLGPAGKVTMDGPSHQLIMPVTLWRANGHGSFDAVAQLSSAAQPLFDEAKCNLIKKPNTNVQFSPTD